MCIAPSRSENFLRFLWCHASVIQFLYYFHNYSLRTSTFSGNVTFNPHSRFTTLRCGHTKGLKKHLLHSTDLFSVNSCWDCTKWIMTQRRIKFWKVSAVCRSWYFELFHENSFWKRPKSTCLDLHNCSVVFCKICWVFTPRPGSKS